MIFIKFFILFLLSISLYSKEMYFDTISLSKVKKLIKKEEQIAKAYKQYIINNATTPSSIDSLNLPNGFDKSNLFNTNLSLHSTENYIKNNMPSNVKSALYDEYYSNKNRVYTKAPSSKLNNNVQIILSSKEKYIVNLPDTSTLSITTSTTNLKSTYYLDPQGVLHWYDDNGNILYSYDEKLVVYDEANLIDDNGDISDASLSDKKVLYPGQKILNVNSLDIAEEYVNIGGKTGIIKVGETSRDIGETILKFSRRAGGMIVNGDLYTWGNNVLKGVSIGNNTYTTTNGSVGNSKPVISVLIKAKSRLYGTKNVDNNGDGKIDGADIVYNELYNQNYFSSPLRPKFVDFTSDVYHGTCAITSKGELYCAGDYVFNQSYIDFEGYDRDKKKNTEILHRSVFFDGTNTETVVAGKIKITKRAKRVFSLFSSWFVLSDDGYIYYWGQNHTKRGYTGASNSQSNVEPTLLITNNIRFKDLTYTISPGFRRMVGLSTKGEIYTWGTDSQIGGNNCSNANLCKPKLVKSDITFESILAGQQTVIAKDAGGNFYKISQAKNEEAKVESISTLLESHSDYDATVDDEILSVDISSKAEDGGSIVQYDSYGKGIIWVNGKNQLKGDYFTKINKLNIYTTEEETLFKNTIKDIDWKIIRMIEDQNGMCGISTENQMYCWGQMVFYQGSNGETQSKIGNTVMLPIFNSNLLDLDKDFLFVEDYPFSIMKTDKDGVDDKYFFMKYPTYIGGFNYEFKFK